MPCHISTALICQSRKFLLLFISSLWKTQKQREYRTLTQEPDGIGKFLLRSSSDSYFQNICISVLGHNTHLPRKSKKHLQLAEHNELPPTGM